MSASVRRSARVQASTVTNTVSNTAKVTVPRKRSRATANTNGSKQTADSQDADGFKIPATPSPVKRRRPAADTAPPPVTPTPSAIGVMFTPGPRVSYSVGDIDDPTPPVPLDRPAAPELSNAPLHTTNGETHVLSANRARGILPNPTLSTATLLEDAKAHLIAVDPSLKPLIDAHHCRVFDPSGLAEEIDPFRSLASGIMAQQVSGAAASSIKQKFISLFPANATHPGPPTFPSPELVAGTELSRLREAGLSQRKAEYIKGLAEKFRDGELSAELLAEASDEEVMEKLIAVRGLGQWSVEMFMIFALHSQDILSTLDLGVQRGMAIYKGKNVDKLKNKGGKWKYMSEQEMIDTAEKFRPYRSLFMWYMWRIETAPGKGSTNVEALQDGTAS
ncbi:DNA glycosylase [Myriangium duriaei CBS 260.36]|uniref:DNA glycosylase n=1 Tax=Myriangium duriaei CBS 260.36 TaxID=1168546 RepID=A0A9P4J589_9PEZI|nr:DNA glycosylase [Myriangium duriaei CBS 260.36]